MQEINFRFRVIQLGFLGGILWEGQKVLDCLIRCACDAEGLMCLGEVVPWPLTGGRATSLETQQVLGRTTPNVTECLQRQRPQALEREGLSAIRRTSTNQLQSCKQQGATSGPRVYLPVVRAELSVVPVAREMQPLSR